MHEQNAGGILHYVEKLLVGTGPDGIEAALLTLIMPL